MWADTMNWTEHQKYSPIYQRFIFWYKERVDITTFYSLTDIEATNIDNYLRCFHGVTTDENLFSVAKKTYLGVKLSEAIHNIHNKPVKNVATPLDFPLISKGNWMCVYCEESATTVDHLIPISKGGTNDKRNLAHCCESCNTLKGSQTLTQFSITLDRLIIQSNEMGHADIVGRYGLMLLNANKLLVYEEKHIGKMYKPEKITKRRSVTKRSLKAPLNMSEIKIVTPRTYSRKSEIKKAKNTIEQLERPKIFISEHVPYHTPKPKIDEHKPSYLDKQIAIARAAGFEKLWMYEQAHPELLEHRRYTP